MWFQIGRISFRNDKTEPEKTAKLVFGDPAYFKKHPNLYAQVEPNWADGRYAVHVYVDNVWGVRPTALIVWGISEDASAHFGSLGNYFDMLDYLKENSSQKFSTWKELRSKLDSIITEDDFRLMASEFSDPLLWQTYELEYVTTLGVDSGQIAVINEECYTTWQGTDRTPFDFALFDVLKGLAIMQPTLDRQEISSIREKVEELQSLLKQLNLEMGDYQFASDATLRTSISAGPLLNRVKYFDTYVTDTVASAFCSATAYGDGAYSLYAIKMKSDQIVHFFSDNVTLPEFITIGYVVDFIGHGKRDEFEDDEG